MIRVSQIKCRPGQGNKELENKIRKVLHLKKEADFHYQIVKCSIDARKKPDIYYSYTADVSGLDEKNILKRCKGNQISIAEDVKYRFPKSGEKKLRTRPVIIGTGPAGLFCGYMLALHGYAPVLLERGMDVERRFRAVESFWQGGSLNTECNVQFGEGGAGTFSDGKLNTLVKDKNGRNKEVLSVFVKAGAPEKILYEGKPHIGTDILMKVVKNMRQTIEEYGGEVRFDTKMTDLQVEDGSIKAVICERDGRQETILAQAVVLAVGHSARDTFEMLYERKIPMEAKAFAVGLRTEHPQTLINYAQYGREEAEYLPPASYKLTAQTKEGRGVYSFCMCPGGYVVDASSEDGRLAVNGMSYSKRDGSNANSAIIVSVTPKDYGSAHPLAGVEFQRSLEERAYQAGEGKIPVEYYGDFKRAVLREDLQKEELPEKDLQKKDLQKKDLQKKDLQAEPLPEETAQTESRETASAEIVPQIKGGWRFAEVHNIMPQSLNRALVEGMEHFNHIIPGFAADGVTLSGIESRTSSPLRIHRDETGQSQIRGLYPCGEGAGYAGGITSAAMDGIRIAEQIAGEYQPLRSLRERKEER